MLGLGTKNVFLYKPYPIPLNKNQLIVYYIENNITIKLDNEKHHPKYNGAHPAYVRQ